MPFDEATLVNYKAKKSKQACRTKVRTQYEEQCEKAKQNKTKNSKSLNQTTAEFLLYN